MENESLTPVLTVVNPATQKPKKRPRARRISVLSQNRKAFDSGEGQLANRQAWDAFKRQIVHYAATSSSIPQAQFICGGVWRGIVQSLELMFERLGIFQRTQDSLSIGGEL